MGCWHSINKIIFAFKEYHYRTLCRALLYYYKAHVLTMLSACYCKKYAILQI